MADPKYESWQISNYQHQAPFLKVFSIIQADTLQTSIQGIRFLSTLITLITLALTVSVLLLSSWLQLSAMAALFLKGLGITELQALAVVICMNLVSAAAICIYIRFRWHQLALVWMLRYGVRLH